MQQQLADNRVRWVNQQELHRPDSRRRSRRTPEASRSRENPRDFGQPARLQWAAECENYPGGWELGVTQPRCVTGRTQSESISVNFSRFADFQVRLEKPHAWSI